MRAEWLNMISNDAFNAFGPVWVDSDLDGLSDAWEFGYFPSLTSSDGTADGDGDGASDSDEQEAGTHPGQGTSRLALDIEKSGNGARVWFDTVPTVQPDYGGMQRYYDLDYNTNLFSPWTPVDTYTNILGNCATIIHTNTTDSNAFYRVRTGLR